MQGAFLARLYESAYLFPDTRAGNILPIINIYGRSYFSMVYEYEA